jgi:2-amino-4-hydroxy-6-hydroxymethyldihydropteridine diphosphokinase
MSVVFLGLGSNLGDRFQNIHDAVDRLSASGVVVQKLSTLIETDPVDIPFDMPQGKFVNAVVKAETALSPQELLKVCQKIEIDLGRVRSVETVKNGPRTIDIDILLFDDLTLDSPQLTIPHPRMRTRAFVMVPLKEIAPEIFGTGRS